MEEYPLQYARGEIVRREEINYDAFNRLVRYVGPDRYLNGKIAEIQNPFLINGSGVHCSVDGIGPFLFQVDDLRWVDTRPIGFANYDLAALLAIENSAAII